MKFILQVISVLLAGLTIDCVLFCVFYNTFMEKYLNDYGKQKFESVYNFMCRIASKCVDLIKWFINIDKVEQKISIVSGTFEEVQKIFDEIFKGIIENAVIVRDYPFLKNISVYVFENATLTDVNMTESDAEKMILNRLYAYIKKNYSVDPWFNKYCITVKYNKVIEKLEIRIADNNDGYLKLKDNQADEEEIDIFSDEISVKQDIMSFGYRLMEYNDWNGKIGINLTLSSHCHALITGSSGSGKSTATLWLLTNFIQAVPNQVYIADFKGNREWKFLSDYPYYYAGEDCMKGLRSYYEAFKEALKDDAEPCVHHLLILEEYPAMITYLTMKDKLEKTKLAIEVQSIVAEILALGRSIGYGLWITAQRNDASLFAQGSRDNFMVTVALGNISKEHMRMVCNGYEMPAERVYKAGEGILIADGYGVSEVKYPLLKDLPMWKQQIHRLLMQDFLEDAKGIGE